MKDKAQIFGLIGVALLIVGGVLMYISLTSPKVYENKNLDSTSQQQYYTVNTEYNYDNNAYPVNINTATVEELQTVDGIGESKAKNIVAYRNQIGSYSSLDKLKNIDGIGDKLFEQISPYLTV